MEKTADQIHKERRDITINQDDGNSSLRRLQEKKIEGYIPPSKVNSSTRTGIYSNYTQDGDPYKEVGKSKGKYAGYGSKGYTVQKCFKCEKPLTDCSCSVKSTVK